MFKVDPKLVEVGFRTAQTGSTLVQVGYKSSPRQVKMAQVEPSWRQSGPRTGQVGGKTATSTPKLTPRWAKSAPRQTK